MENLTQNRLVSSYIVSDGMNNHERLRLNIINSEFTSKKTMDFFINEFITITSIDNNNIIKVFDFGLIYSIDNKKVSNNEYFYTNEYIDNNITFCDFIEEINEYNLLDMFIQVCKSMNYLHLRGFIYGDLNTNNIIINKVDEKYTLMVKDLPTLELEKHDYWSKRVGLLNYRSTELKAYNNPTISSDIYSLGVFLLALCKVDLNEAVDINKITAELKKEIQIDSKHSNNTKCFYDNIIKIAEKMLDPDIKKSYSSIVEIVEDINFVFHKTYESLNREELEKPNFNTKIVGRCSEIEKILNAYDNLKNYQATQKVIFVHGEQGIGKTKLLKEINHILSMKRANIYSSFSLESTTLKSTKAFTTILRNIVAECDDEIIKRYQSELIKFIPELGERNNIKASETLNGEKEKYRLLSRLSSFIHEAIKNVPTIFIIDNANYLDEFSIEFLDYFSSQSIKDNYIMYILSYSDGQFINTLNPAFKQFLNKTSNYMNIHLDNLSKEETAIMIQGILRMPTAPNKFGAIIYSKTYGNPLFIEETLKDSLAKKILHVPKIRGKWTITYDTYEEMQIASTMEQALLNQIKEIPKESYTILSTISIFSEAVSVQIINKFFSYTELYLENFINDLSSKGILCKKIEDRGFVFDFNNKVLKKLIYNNLSQEERKNKHKIAVGILENILEMTGRENSEELIYHLEKSEDKNKVAKYRLENAKKMEKLKFMDEAISNYEKSFNLFSDKLDLSIKMEILLKIGDIHAELGNLTTALQNYKDAYKYAIKLDANLQVDTLNKIAEMHINKNEVEEALKYILKSDEKLNQALHTEGYLENKRILVVICMLKQEYGKAFDISTTCIKLCGSEYVKYKGIFHKSLGLIYMETSRITEALASYKQSMKYFEEVNYTEGVLTALNNIGVIYVDYYENTQIGIGYYNKMKEISRTNNISNIEALALTNLASAYLENVDYEISLKYFKEALEKSKQIEYETNIFYCYNYLSYVTLKMGNYNNAYEYQVLAEKELEQFPTHGKYISIYYQMGAEFYYGIGDIDTAYSLITKALDIYNTDGSTQYKDSMIMFHILEICKTKDLYNLDKSIQAIKDVMNTYRTDIRRVNILYDLCILLYEKGYGAEATKLLEENSQRKPYIITDEVNVKGLYLDGLTLKGKYKFEKLNSALELSKKIKNKLLQWKICSSLGDYYHAENNYFYAANYYFEACEIIKDSILQLPLELRINCFKSNNMTNPFNKINGMNMKYNHNKIINISENKVNISSNEDLDRLLNYDNFSEILNNKRFIKSAKNIYSLIMPEGIRDINDIINNMHEDSIIVLDTLTKLLSSMVLSTRSLIILDNHKGEYSVIATSNEMYELPEIKSIMQRVKETNTPLLLNAPQRDKPDLDFNFMPKGIKAIICIPISTKDNIYSINGKNIKGYLYMESERILNNFNQKSLQACTQLTSFVSFVLESYQLKITSSIDKLTGAITRKSLEDSLIEHIEKASSLQEVFSIIMLDLDDFKNVNDRFGHITGDKVLKDVAKIVMDSIRKEDIFGRYGGEEFIIILPKTDIELATEVAERIRVNIESKKILGDKRPVTVSMGISTYPIHAKWKQELVEKADQALYVAKENGKNRSIVWNDDYAGKAKGTYKLSGIVTGNMVQDSRNILVMVDLIEQIKIVSTRESKFFNLLGRIIEITEAQNGFLFIIKDNLIQESYGRKIFEEDWSEPQKYNKKIIQSILDTKQGLCMIDWDDIIGYDTVTMIPDWNSVIAVPLINSGVVKGILYLTVSIKAKEFKLEELNFVNTLGQLAVAML